MTLTPCRLFCVATATALALVSPALGSQAQQPAFDVFEKSIFELQNAMGAGHDHVAAARRAVPRAHRGVRPARPDDQRVHLAQPESARRGGRARRRAESRPDARPAARHPDRHQRQLRHRRTCRPPAARWRCRIQGRARRVHGEEAAPGRRGRHRQDEPPRAGLRHHVGQLDGRTDAQSLRSDAQPGRLERRHRRGRRGELRGRRHGHRHVRIDPHSVRAQQPVRAARHARACRAATGSSRCRSRRTSADRSRDRSPTSS